MRQAPLISVITITLNDLDGLIYTVKSVESQTYQRYEHIVVDGLSDDGTVEFCATTEKRRTNFSFTSEKDRGIFDAMNKGAGMAHGDLLVFVNANDGLTDPSVLEFVAQKWSESEWQWGYGALRFTDSNRIAVSGTVQAPFSRRKFQLGRQFVPHPASYVDRKFFLENGAFDESFGTAADQEFFMRVCEKSPPAVWIRFLADFMVGGIHSTESIWHIEKLWHQMRVKNGAAIANSRRIDRMASVALASGERSIIGLRHLLRGSQNFAHVKDQTFEEDP
jgi:glycosyltransferase involved in cell wall biosynthesis